jgi:subtilisin family serine protease
MLGPLMERTAGRCEIRVGLIDGPVMLAHPDFAGVVSDEVRGSSQGLCERAQSVACMHGTFVAGILSARRGSAAPAICPKCTLLLRPVLTETADARRPLPAATPGELARAIVDCVDAGAHILNLSLDITHSSSTTANQLEQALNYSARKRVLVVAAAGNRGTVGGSCITNHHWVIPVGSCDTTGMPREDSNLGRSIGRNGFRAPGQNITSLGIDGKLLSLSGTSAACPFVTGTLALLWSEFPAATAAELRMAVALAARAHNGHDGVRGEMTVWRRSTLVPPLLNAAKAWKYISLLGTPRRVA